MLDDKNLHNAIAPTLWAVFFIDKDNLLVVKSMQYLPFSTSINSLPLADSLLTDNSIISLLSEEELFWFLHYCSSEKLSDNFYRS
ncbi:hypothetical protein IQ264_25615 [Phormidium sp. LEGE 05292]|uniref:hypothetical protein n=1 Tax=[Phormidium] sp. LEGE 05292 TaxID=767427 RepID=UPI00187F8873|nr:hypothetical protein [Phormidium sp. LEGE 05292]MBE9228794.1 hypothetical protein [Phormidium sp. LEGE 05292]